MSPRFIGYYTVLGATGYVEGTSDIEVVGLTSRILFQWPGTVHGKLKKRWFRKQYSIALWAGDRDVRGTKEEQVGPTEPGRTTGSLR